MLFSQRCTPCTSATMVVKVKDIVNIYARTPQIAGIVSISLGAAHTILKRDLKK